MVVHATNNKKEYLAVTSDAVYPVDSIEEAIYTLGLSGVTIYVLTGPLKRSYKYVCDLMVDKDVLKGGDEHGLS